MPEPSWIEQLKYMLCQMYKAWGGDCKNLPFDVSQQITTEEEMYKSYGAPSFDSISALQQYLAMLSDTLVLLDSPQNSLSEFDNTRLRALIAQLQEDLPPPN